MTKTMFNAAQINTKLGTVIKSTYKCELENVPLLREIAAQCETAEHLAAVRKMAVAHYKAVGYLSSSVETKASNLMRVIRGLTTHDVTGKVDFEEVRTLTAPKHTGAPVKGKKARAATFIKRGIKQFGYAAMAAAWEAAQE